MEGGFNFPFGGDPEELMRGLREFAEQQAESVQEAQREQFATLTLNTAVELTAAALGPLQAAGSADEQAPAIVRAYRDVFADITECGLDSNVSVKLTALGLKLDYDLCRTNLEEVVADAASRGNFVRIDMEDSSTTDDTLRIYRDLRES